MPDTVNLSVATASCQYKFLLTCIGSVHPLDEAGQGVGFKSVTQAMSDSSRNKVLVCDDGSEVSYDA